MPDEWTWKDLLTSIDVEGVAPEADLADRLIGEIESLGVNPGALLPRSRIEEIAGVLRSGDLPQARDVVRRLAPAAIRRLSRRVLTDKGLRAQADAYVRQYEQLVIEEARNDADGAATARMLGSAPGRAFLLLDAAVGDLH